MKWYVFMVLCLGLQDVSAETVVGTTLIEELRKTPHRLSDRLPAAKCLEARFCNLSQVQMKAFLSALDHVGYKHSELVVKSLESLAEGRHDYAKIVRRRLAMDKDSQKPSGPAIARALGQSLEMQQFRPDELAHDFHFLAPELYRVFEARFSALKP